MGRSPQICTVYITWGLHEVGIFPCCSDRHIAWRCPPMQNDLKAKIQIPHFKISYRTDLRRSDDCFLVWIHLIYIKSCEVSLNDNLIREPSRLYDANGDGFIEFREYMPVGQINLEYIYLSAYILLLWRNNLLRLITCWQVNVNIWIWFDIIQLEWCVTIFYIWFECFVQIVYILSNGSREQNLRQIYRLLDDKQVVS